MIDKTQPKAIIFAPELPYPPNHGGRVDVWSRCQVLRSRGWDLSLVCWSKGSDELRPCDEQVLLTVFSDVIVLKQHRSVLATLRRIIRMANRPSLAADRVLTKRTARELGRKLADGSSAVVVAETPYTFDAALAVAEYTKLPLLLRTHNIEHKYMSVQATLARGVLERLKIAAARWRLRELEDFAIRTADAVADISQDDADFWSQRHKRDIQWIPTFISRSQAAPLSWNSRTYDIGYLGNLWAPNNVDGVMWFLNEVLPILTRWRSLKVLIAGSNPSPELKRLAEASHGVTVVANPIDASSLRSACRVLINPVRAGSGLNTKSIEMLFDNSPIIGTRFSVHGMDAASKQAFNLADTPVDFAEQIKRGLAVPFEGSEARELARDAFSDGSAARMSQLLSALIAGAKP